MNEEEHKDCDAVVQGDGKPAVKHYDHIPEDQYGMFGVHVSGFTLDVTERCLRETFQAVGKVYICKVITVRNNIHMDKGPGYIAFIKFKSEEEALKAMETFDGYQVQNCTLSVRPAFKSRRFLTEKGSHCSEESRRNTLRNTEGKQKKAQKQSKGLSGRSAHSKQSPSSSNPVTSISNNESGRQQCEENGSANSLDSTDQDGKDLKLEGQDRNSTSAQSSVPESMQGIVTDYRLREGLLEKKDVANFNLVLGKEPPESVTVEKEQAQNESSQSPSDSCSESSGAWHCHSNHGLPDKVPVATRHVHDMQHKTGTFQTNPPKQNRTEPNMTPPAMTNGSLSHSYPNSQVWSQGQLPRTTCHNNNNNNRLSDQVPVSTRGMHDMQHKTGPFQSSPPKQKRTQPNVMPSSMTNSNLSHSNPNSQLWSRGQLPVCSNESFIHSQIPSSLSPNGRAKDAMTHLTTSMSYLRVPVSTSPISALHFNKDVTMWTATEVADYVRSSECFSHADFFLEQDIDGQALMLLERGTLLHFMKVGPALRLLHVIDRLKKSRNTFQFAPDQTSGFNGW